MAALWHFLLLTTLLPLCVLPQVINEDDNGLHPDKDPIRSYVVLEKPFRMNKVNLLWEKARKRLAEDKLKLLYSELKIHDKEELTLKKLQANNGDKEGAREHVVRKAYLGMMNKYGLAGLVPEPELTPKEKKTTAAKEKTLFKDKKLQKLWEKAELSGLTDDERVALKNEFKHHEEKVEEYHKLREMAALDERERLDNHIGELETEEEVEARHGRNDNDLNDRRRQMKEEYDRLHKIATNTHQREFEDEKTASLWNLAQEADFNEQELESLRQELHHFEVKLAKLRHLETEIKMVDERSEKYVDEEEKTQGRKSMDNKVKKHSEVIGKMERELQEKIANRHTEL